MSRSDSNVYDINAEINRKVRELAAAGASLNSVGERGSIEIMEQGLTRIEGKLDGLDARVSAKLDGLDSRVRGVEVDVAILKERVLHLPSKGFIIAALMGMLALLAAITVFADGIRAAVVG